MLGTGEGNGICHGFLVSLGVGGWDSLGLEMGERRKSWVERGKNVRTEVRYTTKMSKEKNHIM